ncbi:MAG TPA: DUF502 domain-containing protein [Desulfobacteraceae bacterium]|nr:DUF502 domain-containing protein [Desulfobacteraceae bacterium]HPQ28309.1 DUF502 domain-containing protein [Desulfobacteraceae bacterium]
MKKLRNFVKTSLIGGIAVILPVTILFLIFKWIFNFIINIIQPLTNLLVARSNLQELVAILIVICIILSVCFFVGVLVRTRVGRFIHEHLDKRLSKIIPGYGAVKTTVSQFFDRKSTPFYSVALVRGFDDESLMTAFITDNHPDGSYTVFVPCGPNPTTGYILHMKKEHVHPVPVSAEVALRSVISCGAGSQPILAAFHRNEKNKL